MIFPPSTTVVLREVVEGRVRSARPLRVIADNADRFVGYLVPRSTVAWPRLVDGHTQSQTPDQGWQLPSEQWHGPGSLFIMPAGTGFAAVLFFDRDSGVPVGWKIDFFRPPVRHQLGFDTVDQGFDLLASTDLSSWESKDLDDLAQLIRLGLLSGAEHEAFERERVKVEQYLRHGGGGPFDEPWIQWRPNPSWAPLPLPRGWDDLHHNPKATTAPSSAHPRRPRWCSATGIRLLDDEGLVHLDLDLADGRAWLGHTPPSMAIALQRQLALGWQLGPVHPALDALQRRLSAVLPEHWSSCWADRPYGVDLDESLLAGWPVPVAERCSALGESLGTFGPRLFGGFDRYLVVGPSAALAERAREAPPDILAAIAALETMQLASATAVSQTAARAARLRQRCGLGGAGLVLAGPAGWTAPGVVIPGHGRGLLALCTDDEDEAELAPRLQRWSAP